MAMIPSLPGACWFVGVVCRSERAALACGLAGHSHDKLDLRVPVAVRFSSLGMEILQEEAVERNVQVLHRLKTLRCGYVSSSPPVSDPWPVALARPLMVLALTC